LLVGPGTDDAAHHPEDHEKTNNSKKNRIRVKTHSRQLKESQFLGIKERQFLKEDQFECYRLFSWEMPSSEFLKILNHLVEFWQLGKVVTVEK
jgi:hypothetical protein